MKWKKQVEKTSPKYKPCQRCLNYGTIAYESESSIGETFVPKVKVTLNFHSCWWKCHKNFNSPHINCHWTIRHQKFFCLLAPKKPRLRSELS